MVSRDPVSNAALNLDSTQDWTEKVDSPAEEYAAHVSNQLLYRYDTNLLMPNAVNL